jgi:hypothetical protein
VSQVQATARPKVTRRRASATAPVVEAAPITEAAPPAEAIATEAPVATRPKTRVRKAPVVAVETEPAPEAATVSARTVTDEDIRVRAYFLALESKGRGGSLDYWLRAERELRATAASAE